MSDCPTTKPLVSVAICGYNDFGGVCCQPEQALKCLTKMNMVKKTLGNAPSKGNMLVAQHPVVVYDFFCGCGGTSAGLRNAGMEIALGVDNDPEAAATYRRNFPETYILDRDIKTVQTWELERLINKNRTAPILFSACAPCQPFSKQNRFKSGDDQRTSLLSEFHRFVERFRPDFIFIENVPGMQNIDPNSGPFGEFIKLLGRLGYWHAHKVVQCQNYGIPQFRKRLVLVASVFGPIELPPETHGIKEGLEKLVTVRDAISHLPEIAAGVSSDTPNHRSQALTEINLRRIRAIKEGGGRRDWPEELVLECHKRHDRASRGYSDVYGRLWWDRPSSTITTRCISLSNGRFGHPTQDRALTVREAACLQTFDMDFIFEGTMSSAARQVGNAVPVRLAEAIGRHFLQHIQLTLEEAA